MRRFLAIIIGTIFTLPELWMALKWLVKRGESLLRLGEHIEFIARRIDDLKGISRMLGYLPEIPQWFGIPLLLLGFTILWLDNRRIGKARLKSREIPESFPQPLTVTAQWWPIRDLFEHIRPDLPLTSVKKTGTTVIDDLDKRWEKVGDEVIKQLSLARLHAIGRKEQTRPIRHLAHAPIPSEYWQSARFYYCFLDPQGKEMDHVVNDEGIRYSGLEVNRIEALAIWPPNSRSQQNITNNPLQIIVSTGGEYEAKQSRGLYQTTHTFKVAVKNADLNRFLSNCKFYLDMTHITDGTQLSYLLADTFTLNASEERYIEIVSYDEPATISKHMGDHMRLHVPIHGGFYNGVVDGLGRCRLERTRSH